MKLLKENKSEVAFLDEGTTKLTYYGKFPVMIYYGTNTTTIVKIESLTGYIKTDAGTEVKIEGTLEQKINILETVLGRKLGYNDPLKIDGSVLPIPTPEKTVEFYESADENDPNVITITVIVDGDTENPLTFNFTRGSNAVTIKNLIKKIKSNLNSTTEITSITDSDNNDLGLNDKLLEDQTINIETLADWINKFIIDVHAGTGEYGESTDETPVDKTSNQNKITINQAIVAGTRTITLTGNASELASWKNDVSDEAAHKWFGIDFVFDADKLTSGLIWGENDELTSEALSADEGENTLLVWLNIDDLIENDAVISVKDKIDQTDVEEVTIKFVNTAA